MNCQQGKFTPGRNQRLRSWIDIDGNDYAPFLDRLSTLYAAMDRKYREAADYYGFQCKGCEDNCCFTRFYHYTLLEYLYIKTGYHLLDTERQAQAQHSALDVCRKTREADKKAEPVRLMCPVNIDGLCLIYAHRPMICRLHGIPHELASPGQGVMKASGCVTFARTCPVDRYYKFDRTPFYAEMAALEKELRQSAGGIHKIKKTVAEIIISFAACEGHVASSL
jgi:Fe-S-cluster containining protein